MSSWLPKGWAQENTRPEHIKDKGKCRTIGNGKFRSLLKDSCPMPPRDLYYYDGNDNLAHTFSYSVKDMETKKVYTKVGKSNYECIVCDAINDKWDKRIEVVNGIDQYMRQFRMADSGQVFLNLKAAMDHKPKWYGEGTWHSWFHTCLPDHKDWKDLDRRSLMLKPDWFPDRCALSAAVFRCGLNGFVIFAVAYEVLFSDKNIERRHQNSLYFWFALIVSLIEVYFYSEELFHVLHDSVGIVRRICVNDTVHFQCMNLAIHLDKLALVSILNFLPSSEIVARSFRRKYELFDACVANVEFQTAVRKRDWPMLVLIREYFEGFIRTIAPFIAVVAVLLRVADNLTFLVNRNFSDWTLYQWILYLGFVNQMAGLRNIRDIETEAIKHFMFSGSNACMDTEESLMLQSWISYVLVSAVASVSETFAWPVIDSISFWYSLTPIKVQLMVKDHPEEGANYVKISTDATSGVHSLEPVLDVRHSTDCTTNLSVVALRKMHLYSPTEDPNDDRASFDMAEPVHVHTPSTTSPHADGGSEIDRAITGTEIMSDDSIELMVNQHNKLH